LIANLNGAAVVVVLLAAFLVGWYLAGNELMRRRGRRLAVWCKRALDPLGGAQSIVWLTTHSFRLQAERARPPLRACAITGLTESWDVPMVWLWNRSRGRRDMVLVQLDLARRPAVGLELYRPGALLAADARHLARQEGWAEEPLDEFRLAGPGPSARTLAGRLLPALGERRRHVVRLAVRLHAPHLTLAVNVGEPDRPDPARFSRLLLDLAERAAPD
jgi:hypothetical protein